MITAPNPPVAPDEVGVAAREKVSVLPPTIRAEEPREMTTEETVIAGAFGVRVMLFWMTMSKGFRARVREEIVKRDGVGG